MPGGRCDSLSYIADHPLIEVSAHGCYDILIRGDPVNPLGAWISNLTLKRQILFNFHNRRSSWSWRPSCSEQEQTFGVRSTVNKHQCQWREYTCPWRRVWAAARWTRNTAQAVVSIAPYHGKGCGWPGTGPQLPLVKACTQAYDAPSASAQWDIEPGGKAEIWPWRPCRISAGIYRMKVSLCRTRAWSELSAPSTRFLL